MKPFSKMNTGSCVTISKYKSTKIIIHEQIMRWLSFIIKICILFLVNAIAYSWYQSSLTVASCAPRDLSP